MNKDYLSYIIFIVALVLSFILDLFVFSKKGQEIKLKNALYQYLFWVIIAFSYFLYLWFEFDSNKALDYLSAYLMEMSLSIDNIFVFVMIFSSLQISKENIGRVLIIGVALAVIFRIIFISVGIILVQHFSWILYVFGAFLIYTGYKLFKENPEEENDVKDGRVYQLLTKYLRYTDDEPSGKYTINRKGKIFFTKLALAIFMLGITDIIFALDSIPAVFGITTDNLVVFSSNIFAVLGLRALFFILQKAADNFDYLQQGIAIVLIFIGIKMFLVFVNIHIPNWISLLTIVVCISASIWYSISHQRRKSLLT